MTALTGMSRQKSSKKFFRKIKIPVGDKISIFGKAPSYTLYIVIREKTSTVYITYHADK